MPASNGGAAQARLQAAADLRRDGRPAEALKLLLQDTEFSADIYTVRGDLQVELGQIQDAVSSYSTILAFDSANVYARYQLAQCLRRLGRWGPAAEAFQRILADNPHRDDARIGLGECLLELHRLEEALLCFDGCWSDVTRRQALFGTAVSLQLLQKFDEAERTYERLLALEPKAGEALSNLIALSVGRADFVRAQTYALRLLELSPQSSMALQALTLVALHRHEDDSAARYYDQLQSAAGENRSDISASRHALDYEIPPQAAERLHRARHLSQQQSRSAGPVPV